MFSSTSGFIHVKDYYASHGERIAPCSSTDYYQIKSSNIQIPRNLSISTAHLILDYFQRYKEDPDLVRREWDTLECDRRDSLHVQARPGKSMDPGGTTSPWSYCLKVSYLCDYNPACQIYVLQRVPETGFSDLWSYVWSQNISKMVLLKNMRYEARCWTNYWPEEGSVLYGDFEVSTVSIHLCPWYTTRNFFLKNLITNDTRTVTQFHFEKWPLARDMYLEKKDRFLHYLLQFRREFRASFSDKGSPLLIQSEDGVDTGGTFVVLDSILNRLMNGVRELDIQANVEHFRDQCPGMVASLLNYEIIFDAVSTEILQICNFRPE